MLSASAQRIEQVGRALLIQADCRDVLPLLPKVDAVVTDPPYEFDTSGAGIFRTNRKNMDEIKAAGLSDGFDHSILRSDKFGAAVVFAHNDQWAELLPHMAGEWARFAICQWHKLNPMPVANRHYQPDTEIYVHAWSADFAPVGDLPQKKRYILANGGQDTSIAHPTVKPLQVMQKIIANVAGTTICDPFMGSGSTGVAAVSASRDFIGVEMNPVYFDIACKRISEAQRQGDLFISAA